MRKIRKTQKSLLVIAPLILLWAASAPAVRAEEAGSRCRVVP